MLMEVVSITLNWSLWRLSGVLGGERRIPEICVGDGGGFGGCTDNMSGESRRY